MEIQQYHQKVLRATVGIVAGFCLTLVSGMSLASGGMMNEGKPDAPVVAGVIEGEILEVEEQTLVIQDRNNGKIQRIPIPLNSPPHASDFKVGETVEAVVTPEGITTSVVALEGQLQR